MKNRLLVLLFLFLSLPFGLQAQTADSHGFFVKVGDMAPDFTTELTDGTTFQLSENRGKIVMLQFTASWCSVCRKEMPFIQKDIWEKLKDKDFVLIGIDRAEPKDVVLAFQKQMNITYPLALDPEAEIFSLYAELLAGVTRNVIIDENGKIIYLTRLFQEKEFKEMTTVIEQAVAKIK